MPHRRRPAVPGGGIPAEEKVMLLAAKDRTALIDALEATLGQATGRSPERGTHGRMPEHDGPYRIALFDPTPARIQMAVNIVERDRPWRNKQDIWFSNEAFLTDGKKIAFLFPGLDGLGGGEIGSVARYFGLQWAGDGEEGNDGRREVLHSALQLAERSRVLYDALRKLRIEPDLHAGHSVGEWFAGYAAGWQDDNDIISLMKRLDPSLFELEYISFLMVGCGYDELGPLISGLDNIYLANDNCPQQVVFCGEEGSIGQLIRRLRERQVFHQLLPFRSGFHSPFLRERLPLLQDAYKGLRFKKPLCPLWSATTLEEYPANHDGIIELGIRHLLEPVRFRELTQKLYAEGVRLFIQVGSGGLVGFIDNTLKGKSYSAVAANVSRRPGLAQLRRVLAALFVEGSNEIHPLLAPPVSGPKGRPVSLQLGTPLIKGLASVPGIADRHRRREEISGTSPLFATLMENQRQMEEVECEMIRLFQDQAKSRGFVHQLDISLESHPYLVDHSLFRQPAGWPYMEDRNPVIPMTMLLELFAEIAEANISRGRVRRIVNVSILQWMNVATPFREKVTGEWSSSGKLKMTMEKFASAELAFDGAAGGEAGEDSGGDAVSDAAFDTGTVLNISISPEQIYQQYMFHEAAYRGIHKVTCIAEKGITGLIQSGAGKGSLLDNAGQLYGFWLQLVLPREKVAFPVRIGEVCYFGDRTAQDGLFECTCRLVDLTDELATADFLIRKEGRPWCVIKGWQDRRLELDDRFWRMAYAPLRHCLSEEIAPGIFFFHNAYQWPLSWEFVAKRYFSSPERGSLASLTPKKKKEWMVSRIAAKDAVKSLLSRGQGRQLYPIEITIRSDEKGKPCPEGPGLQEVDLSLAHKGTAAVAVASPDGPVGIDMETIQDRSDDFEALFLHPEERALIEGRDHAEWITRCWVAKEAYGKYLGLGLQGSPLRYRISRISGNDIVIENTLVTTFHYLNYIIGWTPTSLPQGQP
jgi:phosphopantetheinyl transferase/malonyl CoA-acyl carrier protein transacylase